MKDETILKFLPTHIEVEDVKAGAITKKNVAYEQIDGIFSSNESIFESEWLPGEYGIQRLAQRGNNVAVLYAEAPRLFNVTYISGNRPRYRPDYFTLDELGIDGQGEDEKDEDFDARKQTAFSAKINARQHRSGGSYKHYFKLVVPRTLWSFHLKKQSNGSYVCYSSEIYAMRQQIITGKERLYVAPFDNLFGDNRICWGSQLPALPMLKTIQSIPAKFFSMPFNTDLTAQRLGDFKYERHDGSTGNIAMFDGYGYYSSLQVEAGVPYEDILSVINGNLLSTAYTVDDVYSQLLSKI